ncbi:MAG: hypothetical protein ABI822_14795 [Bryobacteraceae bacterium]
MNSPAASSSYGPCFERSRLERALAMAQVKRTEAVLGLFGATIQQTSGFLQTDDLGRTTREVERARRAIEAHLQSHGCCAAAAPIPVAAIDDLCPQKSSVPAQAPLTAIRYE